MNKRDYKLMNIEEFLKSEHLVSFRTDDFRYEFEEIFGHENVISISKSDGHKIAKVRYNGKIYTLSYKYSIFAALAQYDFEFEQLKP